MTWPKKVHVYTDGASRGNPGPASVGIHVTTPEGETVLEFGERLGEQTNNVAEYSAVKKALELCAENGAQEVSLFSDSELLVKQLKGIYKVKSPLLKDLYLACLSESENFSKIEFTHVRREQNKVADKLANLALDRP